MIGEKVVSKKIVTLGKVEALLKDRVKNVEPKFEQEVTIKYVKRFRKLTAKQGESMIKDLFGLDFMDELHSVKVVDLMPADEKDLGVLFSDKRIPLTKAQIDDVLKIVSKYRK